jgi:tetratricopeptide (TPR) repeat protein
MIAYMRGNLDSAHAMAASGDTIADPNARSTFANAAAQIDEVRGRLQAALAGYYKAARVDRDRGAFMPVLMDSVVKAAMNAWYRSKNAESVRTLDAALAAYPLGSFAAAQSPYVPVAVAYALAGRPDRARAVLAEAQAAYAHDASLRRAMQPGLALAMGWVHLAENHPDDAVKSFWASDSLPDGPSNDCAACTAVLVALAYDRANKPDSAIAEYQRFLDTRQATPFQADAQNLAFAYKSLGRLYEAKGDRGNAATYYPKFVELWKSADPDLQPQVQDVRKRLARLSDTEGRH